jgi:hypothetical protein
MLATPLVVFGGMFENFVHGSLMVDRCSWIAWFVGFVVIRQEPSWIDERRWLIVDRWCVTSTFRLGVILCITAKRNRGTLDRYAVNSLKSADTLIRN